MRKSLLLALLCSPLLANTPAVSAADVSSLTACKADGEVWLCASWKNNQMTVYRSQRYISEVEFAGELEPGAPLARIEGAKPGVNAEVGAAQGSYTLQLLACNSEPCRQQLEQLKQIPGSHEVEIKNDNTLWQVLLVGRYGSIKSAQQAAGKLMTQYQLRDKPWVRTIASISRRQVGVTH